MRNWNRGGALLAVLLLVGCKGHPSSEQGADMGMAAQTIDVQRRIESLQAEMKSVAENEAFSGRYFRNGPVEGAWVEGTDLIAVCFNPTTREYEANLVDLNTGRPRWVVVLGKYPLRFAPQAGDRQVVFLFDQAGGMAVINRLTGARDYLSLTTTLDLIPRGPAASSDSSVYVGSLVDNRLWAVDPATGLRGWGLKTKGIVVGGPITTPRLPRRMVIVGTDEGEILGIPAAAWDAPEPDPQAIWHGEILGPVLARPTIATLERDGMTHVSALVSCDDNGLYCLDVATGEPRWVYRTSADFIGSAQSGGGKVFAKHPDGFRVIDLATGKDAWKPAPSGELPRRFETADHAYASGATRTLLSMGGNHVARFHGTTGEIQAEGTLASFDWILPATASDQIVGVTKDGFVIVYR